MENHDVAVDFQHFLKICAQIGSSNQNEITDFRKNNFAQLCTFFEIWGTKIANFDKYAILGPLSLELHFLAPMEKIDINILKFIIHLRLDL